MLLGKEDITTMLIQTCCLLLMMNLPTPTPETTEYAAHLDDPNKPVSEEAVREIIQEALTYTKRK